LLFNAIEFFVFFAIVYALYRILDMRAQNRMLLLASYIFYGWWDVRFLYLVVLSTGLDYCCGLILGPGKIPARARAQVSACLILAALAFVFVRWDALRSSITPARRVGSIQQASSLSWLPGWPVSDWSGLLAPGWLGWSVLLGTIAMVLLANLIYFPIANLPEDRRRKIGLILTISANLCFLGFFKYFNFFIDSADRLLRTLGYSAESLHLHIVLPAGISFYTFQSLSYTIDVYKKRTAAVRSLEDYALFVMFFPVLVAGPIERAGHMMPKLTTPRILSIDQTTRGVFLVLMGLFKKVAIADGLAVAVNSVYASTGTPTWSDVVAATVLFAFQIYCDFSGYTDIARGVGKIMGFDLLLNFNLPYFSRSPSEFWQRWHISLSSWLRDYLYFPLGGNRHGSAKTYRNLMITMVLGGLWHGAAWNYVLWGFYQGAVLCLYRVVEGDRTQSRESGSRPRTWSWAGGLWFLISVGIFFVFTCYGWLLFRAGSLEQVFHYTKTLFVNFGNRATTMTKPTTGALFGLPVLVVFECLEYAAGSRTFYRAWPAPFRGAFYAILIFVLLMGLSNAPTQFIYFQF
jgi:alginate O-acetyltransferase complex protein AlgI